MDSVLAMTISTDDHLSTQNVRLDSFGRAEFKLGRLVVVARLNNAFDWSILKIKCVI